MPQNIHDILKKYVEDVKKLYGNHLKTVILYGSYARGDFRLDSDIDIMILVGLTEQEIKKEERRLSKITFEYDFDYDLSIMPIVKNIDHFNRWLRAYPFYYNVKKEGVELYAT
ncbi:MAG: nucleotidyltransferase domain-containing protein [Lachnospiraceae bacterium]|nr:nucleotidyltransferase domain-containing protein [Lachnospiraceae bacterium]MDE6600831.1 nucleotidyltransferase domain-containing protein [Lachnospiraceae bacterium]MDE7359694.1 nucleotidyltransferase domain-containing protein [Lachnospiraceae bacterium]